MSNYKQLTVHPITRKKEMATWADNYFGRHDYGIIFPDGAVFTEEVIAIGHTKHANKQLTPDEINLYFPKVTL